MPLQVRPCRTPSRWSRVFSPCSRRSKGQTVLWLWSSSPPERFVSVNSAFTSRLVVCFTASPPSVPQLALQTFQTFQKLLKVPLI